MIRVTRYCPSPMLWLRNLRFSGNVDLAGRECGLSLFGMSNYELALRSSRWNNVLMDCWIEGRAALPHPTAPPARDGSIDELEDLELCVLGGSHGTQLSW